MPSELPKRYSKLVLPPGWYLPGRNKRGPHTKSHGLMAFTGKCRAPVKMQQTHQTHPIRPIDLSRGVAQNYKTIDKETFNFLEVVAQSLMKRSREIKARSRLKSLPRIILSPSPPTANVAHVPATSTSGSSAPDSSMMNRLERKKSISRKPVQTSTPSGLEEKTTPVQPVESVRRVSSFKHCSETQSDTSMVVKGPVEAVRMKPFETMMLPADRPRTFMMTCVPCREDSVTNVVPPSPASSVCSSSSSRSLLSLEDLSTSADICDYDIIRLWMSA